MAKDAKDPTDFKPVEYWLGCCERLEEAERHMAAGKPGAALALAGVAAECAIRSLYPERAAFDARHDLPALLSGMADRPPARIMGAALTLRTIWRNNYRYMGADQQDRVIQATRRYPRLDKRDRLRVAAEDALAAARIIIQRARTAWQARNPT